MKVTNGELWGAKQALSELVKERLPVKTAYWLAKLVRKANEQLRDVETVRVKLITQFGSPDAQGTIAITPDSAQWEAFAAAFNELMAQEIEIEGLPMEKILLPSSNGLCVSAATLLTLEPFVEVE